MSIPGLEKIVSEAVSISKQLDGHLTDREVEFLAVLPFLETKGQILEIGTYKGKSTVVLANSAKATGHKIIYSCDPLTLPSETDPECAEISILPEILKNNLLQFGVENIVKFEQTLSKELAKKWNLPIKILWIDGNHTHSGSLNDLKAFEKFLEPGSIVAFHDVLHKFEGPIKVFVENVLSSEKYGDCGLCGSIGWGQFIGEFPIIGKQKNNKELIKKQLLRLIPHISKINGGSKINNLPFNIYRVIIPHGNINPTLWIQKRNNWDKTN